LVEVLTAYPYETATWGVVILGDGSDRPRLEAKAERLGVQEQVTFRGAVSEAEKWQWLMKANCCVLAGFGEGFGIVCLEAAMAGAWPVGSTLDGSYEPTVGAGLGFAADPRSAQSLLLAISEAVETEDTPSPARLGRFTPREVSRELEAALLAIEK